MSSTLRTRLGALAVAAALALPLLVSAPAAARETPAAPPTLTPAAAAAADAEPTGRLTTDAAPRLTPASTATVTGTLRVIDLDGSGPHPATSTTSWVRFWLWDDIAELWLWQRDVDTFGANGEFTASGLTPGDYRIEFVSYGFDIPMREYWNNKPMFAASNTVPVNADSSSGLGTVTLEPAFPEFFRIAGDNRFTTAVAISQSIIGPGQSAPVVYLATGLDYADALSAGPAAAAAGGVMLLTTRTTLPAAVATELDRLNPGRIVVVGGPSVISNEVEQALRAFVGSPTDVVRIAGSDRYATSRLIVADAFRRGLPHLFIATGRNYPDALAAGPAASRLGGAVLLVNGNLTSTDTATRDLITALGLPDLHIAGSAAVVSTGVQASLAAHLGASGTVTRYEGANRYDTARDMNGRIFGPVGADFAFLATGRGFADALAGGPLAAAVGAPLYLSGPACLRNDEYIDMIWLLTKEVYALGGPSVLSDRVLFGQNC